MQFEYRGFRMRFAFACLFVPLALAMGMSQAQAQSQHWIDVAIMANGGCGPHRQLFVTNLPSLRSGQETGSRVNPPLFGRLAAEWTDGDLSYAMNAYVECEARLANTSSNSIRSQERYANLSAQTSTKLNQIVTFARQSVNRKQTQRHAQHVDAERQANEAVERAKRDSALATEIAKQAELEERRFAEAKNLADEAKRQRMRAEQRLSEAKQRREAEERRVAEAGASAHQATAQANQIAALPAPTPYNSPIAPREQPSAQAEEPGPVGSCKPTKEKYLKLQTGMNYRQVQAIMGCEGEETSQNQIAGIRTTNYVWSAGLFGGSVSVIFQGFRLSLKSQFGLE